MTRLLLAMSAVMLFGFSASADWGSGQDIADQWRGGRTAYGGSGNPYSGGYDGGYYDGHSRAYYRTYPGYRYPQYRTVRRGCGCSVSHAKPVRHARPVRHHRR